MALRFFTGFNGIDTSTLTRRFDYVGGFGGVSVGAVGRFGQGVTLDSSGEISIALPTGIASYTYGMSVMPSGLYTVDSLVRSVVMAARSTTANARDAYQLLVHYRFDLGTWELIGPGPTGAALWTGATSAYALDTWYFLELQTTVSATSGSVILRIDGATVFSASGINTRGLATVATSDFFIIGGEGVGPAYVDCVYITDTTGTSPHNGFLDPCRADPVFTAADQSVDFTPLSGTNESNIDDGNTPDDDATYNSSTTKDATDLFTVAGYTAPGAEILGYAVRAQGVATAADGRQLAAVWDDGSSDIGAALNMTAVYQEALHVVPEDPTTFASAGAASTAINALRIGYTIPT